MSLGYAITGHAAQGMTCGQTFVLATDGLSKEWAYVALSRGRESNRLYVTREARESAELMPNRDGAWRPADVLRDGLTRSARMSSPRNSGGAATVLSGDERQRASTRNRAKGFRATCR